MKILIMIKSLASQGGAERALANLATELVGRGHQIDIVVLHRAGERPAYPLPPEVTVRCLAGMEPACSGLFRSGQARLQSFVARNRYDVVLGWLRHGGAMVGRLPRRRGTARVGAMRNLPYTVAPTTKNPFKMLKFLRRRKAFGGADLFLVQMKQFVAMLPPAWQGRCRVIPNAVAIAPPPSAIATREKLIVAVSRIVSQKRLGHLVRAFALFHSTHPDWRLEIWGQGRPAARERLQSMIAAQGLADSVRLMGVTDDIDAVYRRARILAHPSRREGMSNAVTEAMMHGLAVVACTDCAGMDELIDDGVSGRLIDPGPHDRQLAGSFGDALRMLADDPQMAQEMGLRARQHLIDNFSHEAVFDRWEQVLLDAAADAAR